MKGINFLNMYEKQLLKKVIEQIKTDVNNDDFTAIEELLSDVTTEKLINFLSEENCE